MPTPFDKEQPVAQQFTPQAKKNYVVETVIADTWVMNVYEVSATGERKTIGVPKKMPAQTDCAEILERQRLSVMGCYRRA